MSNVDYSPVHGIRTLDSFSLSRLVLTDFRNYTRAVLEPAKGPVVLTGPNGAGKTNLLEAISLLAPGRGLRRAELSRLRRITAPELAGWGVAAHVDTPAGQVEIGTGMTAGQTRRTLRIDGIDGCPQSDLAERVGLVWLVPQMDRILTDGATGRRRFLDRLVFGFDRAHAGRISRFERAMRERSRLLSEGRADAAWLSGLEVVMAETGIAITAARIDIVRRLDAACCAIADPFPEPGLRMIGTLSDWLEDGPALAAEDRYRAALQDNRRRDAETGGSGTGPHRDDLDVMHRTRGISAALCSTGEQKALLVSIVLAHACALAAEAGAMPILLLDEIAAHLDADRRASLLDALLNLSAQVFLTGTDPNLFAGLNGRAQFFTLAAGRIASGGF